MALDLVTRFLSINDIPSLLVLESCQWTSNQAADAETLRSRMIKHPDLCVGAFCKKTGKAVTSLFLCPVNPNNVKNTRYWLDHKTNKESPRIHNSKSLFGISLTSISPEATVAVFQFLEPYLMKNGWREVYLGSPVPGLKSALEKDPGLDAKTYVHTRRGGAPLDQQLRLYHSKGFTDIVAVLPKYFPHEESLDYGVLIRGQLPLSRPRRVRRRSPLQKLRAALTRIARIKNEDQFTKSSEIFAQHSLFNISVFL